MSDDKIDQNKCEENRKDIYERVQTSHNELHGEIGAVQKDVNKVQTDVSSIKGGVRVVVFMLPILAALVGMVFHTKLEVISTKIDSRHPEVHGGTVDDDQDNDSETGQAASEGGSGDKVYMDDLEAFENDGDLGPLLRGEEKTLERRTRESGGPGASGPDLGLRDLKKEP